MTAPLPDPAVAGQPDPVADFNLLLAAVEELQSGLAAPVIQRRTSGDVTVTSSTWVNVDTGLDVTLPAASGDVIQVGVSGVWANEATYGRLDVVTVVGGSPVRSLGQSAAVTTGGGGITSALSTPSSYTPITPVIPYVVQSGDVSGGTVTLRLRTRVDSGTKTLFASAGEPLIFWARNLTYAHPAVAPTYTTYKVRRNAALSVANNSPGTPLSWDTEELDLGAWASGDPTKLTIPVSGRYEITLSLQFASAASGVQGYDVSRNGTGVFSGLQPSNSVGIVTQFHLVLDLAAGDYLQASPYHNTGSARNTSTSTWMIAKRIA